jgi:hypothetical protein
MIIKKKWHRDILLYTSEYAIKELKDISELKLYKKLQNDINTLKSKYGLIELSKTSVAETLAGIYLDKGVFKYNEIYDAYQVALATVEKLDIIVSQNLGDIAKIPENIKKIQLMNQINTEFKEGFKTIRINEPNATFLRKLESELYPFGP